MLNYRAVVYLESYEFGVSAYEMLRLLLRGDPQWQLATPDLEQVADLAEDDKLQIARLLVLWIAKQQDEPFSENDQRFWNRARRQARDCPLFLPVTDGVSNLMCAPTLSDTKKLVHTRNCSIVSESPWDEQDAHWWRLLACNPVSALLLVVLLTFIFVAQPH